MRRRLFASEQASLMRARLLADPRTRSGGFGIHPLARERRLLADSLRIPGRISMDTLPDSCRVGVMSKAHSTERIGTMMQIRLHGSALGDWHFSVWQSWDPAVSSLSWFQVAGGWSNNQAEAQRAAELYAQTLIPTTYAAWKGETA